MAALVVLGLALHGAALRGWWLTDDPQVLVHAIRYTPSEVLLDADAWKYLSSSSFTPLVTISFDLDHEIAGTDPTFYYAHQIAAIIVAALLLFAIVSFASGTAPGLIAGALFLSLPPVFVAARSLMMRHYVEGLCLALVALLLWRRDLAKARPPRLWVAWVIAVLYLMAMLAKEVYVPLPLLMIVLSMIEREPLRRTAVRLAPSVLAAFTWLVWRWRILGSTGGYGELDLSASLGLPSRIARAIIGVADPAAVATGLTWNRIDITLAWVLAVGLGLVIGLAVLRRFREATLVMTASAVAVLLPLLFVGAEFDRRYALVATAILAAAAGLATRELRLGSGPAMWFVAALVCVAAASGVRQAVRLSRETRPMTAEGHYIWTRPQTAPVLLAESPGWYLTGLSWLRLQEERVDAPQFVLSEEGLVLGSVLPSSVARWDDSAGRIIPLSGGDRAEIDLERSRLDPEGDLSLGFEKQGDLLRWTVGPAGGTFTMITVPLYDDFPLPEKGVRRLPRTDEKQSFRVRRDADDGTWTVSPVFDLPRAGDSVHWQRTKQSPSTP